MKILIGDTIEQMRTLPDASVHCCVTSPPYWGLRDYGTATWEGGDPACDHSRPKPDGGERSSRDNSARCNPFREVCGKCGAIRIDNQIGLEATPELFVAKMVEVFREVRRVLHPSGCCFVNLGDSYYSDPKKGGSGTPNGRNGQGEGYARGLRAAACDISGKAPEDSPLRDCLCGNLCGVCREVYRHTSHSDPLLVSMLLASLHGSTHERTESLHDHLPTSDSFLRADHTEVSTPDRVDSSFPDAARLRASLASMLGESSPQLLGECLRRASGSFCLLCERTLEPCAPSSACTARCNCDTFSRESDASTFDKGVSVSAYPHSTRDSLKPKDLVGIPWLVAFALRADGWWLRQDIIWAKPNPMPESVTDRCTKSHEYLFLLTKSQRYYFDAEAIKEPSTCPDDTRPPNGSEADGQRLAAVKRMPPIGGIKHTENGHNQTAVGNTPQFRTTRNRRSVWTITPQPFKEAHFATYPEDLVEPCIRAGSSEKGCCPACLAPWERVVEKSYPPTDRKPAPNKGRLEAMGERAANMTGDGFVPNRIADITTTGWQPTCKCPAADPIPCTVLDPFLGSGTTLLVARKLGRDGIGCELNPTYAAMAEKRIGEYAPLFGA